MYRIDSPRNNSNYFASAKGLSNLFVWLSSVVKLVLMPIQQFLTLKNSFLEMYIYEYLDINKSNTVILVC